MTMSSSTPVVLVLGADGQLGRAIVERFGRGANVHALNRRELDITDAAAVAAAVARLAPTLLVNCAAFNDVDGAQQQQTVAFAINGLAPGILARAAQAAGAGFVHYSTDFVFAGREDRSWTEADPAEPQSVYAQSKLVGEWLTRDCDRHYVLRVESLFGGSLRRSTIDRVVAALREGRPMNLFHDRTVSPSFVDDVAEATWQLVERRAEHGVYHCVNGGATTWLGVGQTVARTLGLDESLIVPTSVSDVVMKAPRPQFAVLSNEKLARAGVIMPRWEDAVARYLSRLPA
jgi:dTDP-4-dehydrorhamnose reductase